MISRSFGKEQLYLQYFFKKQIRYTVYLHWKELHSSYMIVLICWFNPWFYQNMRLSCRNIHYIHVHQLES